MSESENSAQSGLSRGAIRKARKAGQLVVSSNGQIEATAPNVRHGETTDPDQYWHSTDGDAGFSGSADISSYLKTASN